ncbi:glycosyltransferase family 4 protein [Paenibacillus sp. S-12]|uniref:glycosyltransferase family 4 protein n=1 Tax=Paenibacillus sp. S-12 TaxID=3031371 RepID=UPI0025A1E7AF|nr:glycosyltransferase family 4 protein [Paenibacillus sp. S-12]
MLKTAKSDVRGRQSNTRKPRILLSVTIAASVSFFEGHIHALIHQGYDVAVICDDRPSDALLEGAEYIRVPMKREISLLSDLASLFHAVRAIRRWKPDLINTGTPKAGLIMGLAAWICRVPHRIYTCHGLRLETLQGWKRIMLTWSERISGRAAHQVISVSGSLRQRLIALGLASADKVKVLHHGSCKGVDASKFEPSEELQAEAAVIRQQLNIPVEAEIIGFVGRQTRDKGLDLLVEAFLRVQAQFPHLYLLILGNEEEGDPIMDHTKRAIAREPRIISGGYQERLAPFFSLMTMLVLPSYREGFGNVVLEAGAAGIPVIASDVTGLKDAVVNGVTGSLVPAGDVERIADQIREFILFPLIRQYMGSVARKRVKEHYNPADIIAAHEAFYRSMLQSTARGIRQRELPAERKGETLG